MNQNERKSAYTAIVGRPNVGKSSILNSLVGQKIAIVSKKPQTTRTRIMGIVTRGDIQLVFLDTPGLIKPKNPLGEYMVRSVTSSIAGVDFCLLTAEGGNSEPSKADEQLAVKIKSAGLPAVLAINKIDLLPDKSVLMRQIESYSKLMEFSDIVPVSAKTGDGMEELWKALSALSQPGGFLFPEDSLTDQPERVMASEMVREKILRGISEEIPHGVAVVTESMKESSGVLHIDVTIYCERSSHKGIIIGKGGAMLKKIGTQARLDMEAFFDCKVDLKLWVKVKEDWRSRPEVLHGLGFDERGLKL